MRKALPLLLILMVLPAFAGYDPSSAASPILAGASEAPGTRTKPKG
jgi:hypothetical protein